MSHGVILYGPPAAGKDTVTHALQRIDTRYSLFPRLKVGPGKTAGYRMTSAQAIETLRARGQIVWENHRYDATYAIDLPSLLEQLDQGMPIVHLGQVEAIDAVVAATPHTSWITAYLWCPRDIAARRIMARGNTDVDARLHAWDETSPAAQADIAINTAEVTADDAAAQIHGCLHATQ